MIFAYYFTEVFYCITVCSIILGLPIILTFPIAFTFVPILLVIEVAFVFCALSGQSIGILPAVFHKPLDEFFRCPVMHESVEVWMLFFSLNIKCHIGNGDSRITLLTSKHILTIFSLG